MSVTRYRIVPARGKPVVGVVQGAGGAVVERAANGYRLDVYEPEPGCVLVYPRYSARGFGAVA